jgi:hypothetical protein
VTNRVTRLGSSADGWRTRAALPWNWVWVNRWLLSVRWGDS